MRKFTTLIILLFWVQICFSQIIDSLRVFYIPFNTQTRYGYWEKDLIIDKTPKISQNELWSNKSMREINERLLFIKNNARPMEEQSRDLRMVCIFYNSDKSSDSIGFSYLNQMSINGILYKRDDYLLRTVLKFIGNKSLSKTVKPYLED